MAYHPTPGTFIQTACAEAVEQAKATGLNVWFRFNDVELIAKHDTNPDDLVAAWKREVEWIGEQYRNSPAGRADAARRAEQIDTRTKRASELLSEIDSVLAGRRLGELMDWFKEFTPLADDVCVTFNQPALAEKFVAARYVPGYGVGRDPGWFNSRTRMARYIVGQAISCLMNDMPPHPITIHFIEKYEALPLV